MTMGSRIAQLRNRKGYTQEYLAVQLGISRQAVHKWEKNETKPDTDNLILLAQVLEADVDYLVTGTEHTNITNKRNLPKLWSYLLVIVVTVIITFIGTVIFIANQPVSFDAGACGGGFETAIFDQYANTLLEENYAFLTNHLDENDAETVTITAIRESRNVTYKDKAIYMSFDVEYVLGDNSTESKTLHFVGERKWIQKYNWKMIK